MNFLISVFSRVLVLNLTGFEGFQGSKKGGVEVDDPLEARTWEIVFLMQESRKPNQRTVNRTIWNWNWVEPGAPLESDGNGNGCNWNWRNQILTLTLGS